MTDPDDGIDGRDASIPSAHQYADKMACRLVAQSKGVQAPEPSSDTQQGVYIPENAGSSTPFDESEILEDVTQEAGPQQAFPTTDLAQEMLDMQLLEDIGKSAVLESVGPLTKYWQALATIHL